MKRAVLIFALLALTTPLWAQQKDQVPTFHAKSNLVLVDVVATDASGAPVKGLAEADFTVLEDGKPQKIVSFTPVVPPATKAAPLTFHLPPGQYTNVPTSQPDTSLTMIVFDTLNTPLNDQPYARKQLLKVLAGLPPGRRIALFLLDTKLRMLHDVTDDSDVLIAAAKSLEMGKSTAIRGNRDMQIDQDTIDAIAFAVGRDPENQIEQSGSAGGFAPPHGLARLDVIDDNIQIANRAGDTLRALLEIVRMSAGFPGRKNLIWMSSSFPFSLIPSSRQTQYQQYDVGTPELGDQTRVAGELLRANRIAFYPVSTAALATNSPDMASRQTSGGNRQLPQLFADRQESFFEAEDIARLTGGRMFANTNDLAGAVAKSIEDGSTYYSMAYRPTNDDYNGKVRHIKVEASRPGIRLQYRNAYYAYPDDPKITANIRKDTLQMALRPEVPEYRTLYMKVAIEAPTADRKTVRITYLFDLSSTAAAILSDGRRVVQIDYQVVAWDEKKKGYSGKPGELSIAFTPDEFQKARQQGVQAVQELELGPGQYTLKLAAADRNSEHIGTIEAPVTVEK